MKMSSEKKKIFGVILSFLLVFSMSVPVMAEDENYPRYLDDAGLLSSSQAQKLEKKLDKISKEHHCDVVIAVAILQTARISNHLQRISMIRWDMGKVRKKAELC